MYLVCWWKARVNYLQESCPMLVGTLADHGGLNQVIFLTLFCPLLALGLLVGSKVDTLATYQASFLPLVRFFCVVLALGLLVGSKLTNWLPSDFSPL